MIEKNGDEINVSSVFLVISIHPINSHTKNASLWTMIVMKWDFSGSAIDINVLLKVNDHLSS